MNSFEKKDKNIVVLLNNIERDVLLAKLFLWLLIVGYTFFQIILSITFNILTSLISYVLIVIPLYIEILFSSWKVFSRNSFEQFRTKLLKSLSYFSLFLIVVIIADVVLCVCLYIIDFILFFSFFLFLYFFKKKSNNHLLDHEIAKL